MLQDFGPSPATPAGRWYMSRSGSTWALSLGFANMFLFALLHLCYRLRKTRPGWLAGPRRRRGTWSRAIPMDPHNCRKKYIFPSSCSIWYRAAHPSLGQISRAPHPHRHRKNNEWWVFAATKWWIIWSNSKPMQHSSHQSHQQAQLLNPSFPPWQSGRNAPGICHTPFPPRGSNHGLLQDWHKTVTFCLC